MNPQMLDVELRLMHRHSDGSWAQMDEELDHSDPAQHDPERDWPRGRIFRCRTCPERLTILRGETDAPEDEGAG